MKHEIYPAVQVIRDEISKRALTYDDVAVRTGMSSGRLRNILTGRVDMTIRDRDIICNTLGIYPGEVVMQREDLTDSQGFIDIRKFPHHLQEAIRLIATTLGEHIHTPRKKKKSTKT